MTPSTVRRRVLTGGWVCTLMMAWALAQAAPASASCPSPDGDAYSTAVLADAPVAYYRLDESSGPTMCDSSTAANNGTYNAGGITYGVAGSLIGASDTALTADGTNGVIGSSGADSGITGNQSWTLEGSFRSTGTTQSQALVDTGVSTPGTPGTIAGLTIWNTACNGSTSNSTLGLDEFGVAICWDTATAGVGLFDGQWHHLAVTYDAVADQLTGYVDGVSLGAQTPNTGDHTFNMAAGPIRVGKWIDTFINKPLNGGADEVAVYPSALSAARIAAHYQAAGHAAPAPPPPPPPGPQGHTTRTALSCDRGADPSSPWTCIAAVLDTDTTAPSTPGGTVSFASTNGGAFDSASCVLSVDQASPNTAFCSVTFTLGETGTTLTASYPGDSQHAAGSQTFTIKGPHDVLFCGADPLPACPAGQQPPEVCVSIWVGDCDGRLPPPRPLTVCVSAWQDCSGVGGKPGRTKTIDLSGLPPTTTTPVACGKQKAMSRGLAIPDLTKTCQIMASLWDYSSITNAKDYAAQAKAFRQLVDDLLAAPPTLPAVTSLLAPPPGSAINAVLSLAHFESSTLASAIRAALTKEAVDGFTCMAKAGESGDLCATIDEVLAASTCGNPLVPNAPGTPSKTDQQTCGEAVNAVQAAFTATLSLLEADKAKMGVDKPFKAGTSPRATAGESKVSKARRVAFPIMAGTVNLVGGHHGKLRMTLAKSARKRLRAMRKHGTRLSHGYAVVLTGRILGLEPRTSIKTVRIRLR